MERRTGLAAPRQADALRPLGRGVELFLGEVAAALWQPDGEDGALYAVGAVAPADGAVVHVDNHLAQVQADARSLNVGRLVGLALVETVKEVLHRVLAHTRTGVGDGQFDVVAERTAGIVVVALREHHADVATVVAVLEGVRQQVRHHLVELCAVNPCRDVLVAGEREVDAALAGVVLIDFVDGGDEVVHVGLAAVQVHLLLVNLAHVENLVHQREDALGVAVDDAQVLLRLVVEAPAAQLLKRSQNQRQRRAYVVSGIDEELHLVLVQALAHAAAVGPAQQSGNTQQA